MEWTNWYHKLNLNNGTHAQIGNNWLYKQTRPVGTFQAGEGVLKPSKACIFCLPVVKIVM